jgi:predicted DNA binding CopG/RHH family protein
MNGLDVLKSYLVSLGFELDMSSYAKFNKALKDVDDKVEKHTTGMAKEYLKATTIVTSALASIGFATISLMNKIADADLEYQKFAMHMFMSKDAAKEMKIAADALGESLEDIAWMPELREKFFALKSQARGMETPKEAEAQLKYIRSIQFEFKRLQIEITYGMEWIGHQLFKYLAGPLKEIKAGLSGMNDWIQAHMPEWSEKVARIIAVVIQLIGSALRFVKNLFMGFKEIWDMMPDWGKKVAIAFAVAFAPISPAIKIVSALLLLIDDFYAYIDGRKSSKTLAPIWGLMTKAIDFITRGIVSAMVLIDNLYGKIEGTNKKTISEIVDDVAGAWSGIEGFSTKGSKTTPGKIAEGMTTMASGAVRATSNYQTMTSQGLQQSAGMPTLGGSQKTDINVGGVTVNVQGSNATTQDIFKSVRDGVISAGERLSLNTRQVARP